MSIPINVWYYNDLLSEWILKGTPDYQETKDEYKYFMDEKAEEKQIKPRAISLKFLGEFMWLKHRQSAVSGIIISA